jgi:hypothetical protein
LKHPNIDSQENNITMDHKEMGWEGVDWIDLAED